MKKLSWPLKVSSLLLVTLSLQVSANLSWSPAPELLGELDLKLVDESSGLAYDEQSGSLFHINDSGDGPHVYVSKLDGSKMKRLTYKAKRPRDVEDLALGPCAPKASERCLYVADIGDNARKRSHITLTLLRLSDLTKEGTEISPYRTFLLQYPDRAHDAESLAVDESATLYILTKEWSERYQKIYPSHLYKFTIPAQETEVAQAHQLQHFGSLDFQELLPNAPWWGQTPTAMDLDQQRGLLFVLTYSGIATLPWEEVKSGGTIEAKQVNYLEGPPLPQQEALTLVPGGFVYSTEYVKGHGPASLYFWPLD